MKAPACLEIVQFLGGRRVAAACVVATLLLGQSAAWSQTLVSDKDDYAPGEIAYLTGAGFLPGEPIDLSIAIDDPLNGVHIADYEWTQFDADPAGGFIAEYTVPPEAADMFLTATAMGLHSSLIATATFTDHPPSNFNAATASMIPTGNTVSLSVVVTQTSGTLTVITGVKARGSNANDVDFTLTGPGTANGNGTWTGSFTGECGRTYRWDKVEITQNHTTGSGSHPADRPVTVSDLSMPACETATEVSCPGSALEGDTSLQVSALVSDAGASSGGQALLDSHTVSASSVTFTVVRNSDSSVVGTATVPVSGGTTGSQTLSVSPLTAGAYTVTAAYLGVSSAPPGGIRFGTSSDSCLFTATPLCEPVTQVTITSPADGAVFTSTNCADAEVTVSGSSDGSSPVVSYALDGGTPQSSSTLTVGLGEHTVTVFSTNECTVNPASATITIFVKAGTELVLNALPESYITGACERSVCATLKDACGSALAGKTVEFEGSIDDGASFFSLGSDETDGSGMACVTFSLDLGPGSTIIYQAHFAGDDSYLESSAGPSDPIPAVYAFGGFGPPLGKTASTGVKQGSTVPVKFRIYDCSGAEICTDMGLGPHTIDVFFQSGTASTSDPTVNDSGASGDNGVNFRYSGNCGVDGNWIFNLKTNTTYALNSTYRIEAALNDGTKHGVYISIKR